MPIEMTILVLLIVGLAFMALEAFMPAFGLLGISGVASFIAALVMISNQDVFFGMQVNMSALVGIGFIGLAVVLVSFYYVQKSRKVRVTSGPEIMPGMPARIIEWSGNAGRVHIDGEVWQATSTDRLESGDKVIIESRDHLTLTVKKDLS